MKVRCGICGAEHDVEWKQKMNGRGDTYPKQPDVWICWKHWEEIHSEEE